MEFLKIVFLCIAAAVCYGEIHDQITARICVEYFTIGHPPIFNTQSPTLLAIGWGFIATWWVGVLLGIPAALVSRVGRWPKFTAQQLLTPIGRLLVVMAILSSSAGYIGYRLASAGVMSLLEPLASDVPAAHHQAFLADMCAHNASYAAGILGGFALCGWVVFQRWKFNTAG